jgi:23S rRNA A1618 N6-methylase RlmF
MSQIGPRRPVLLQVVDAPRYDFAALADILPELRAFLKYSVNENGSRRAVVDFSRPGATLALNKAILAHHLNLTLVLPEGHLIPTVPARQQYLLWALSLISSKPRLQRTESPVMLDVGTGPSAIYCLLAARMLPAEWSFVGTEIDKDAISIARRNICENNLSDRIMLMPRDGSDPLVPDETSFAKPLSLTVCNPPFYDEGSFPADLPRAGTRSQMETKGGELEFLQRMARDSRSRPGIWFTSLIGIKSDVSELIQVLRAPGIQAPHVTSVRLAAGSRTVRWAVGWCFGASRCCVAVQNSASESKWRKIFIVELSARHVSWCDVKCVEHIVLTAFAEVGFTNADPGQILPVLKVSDGSGSLLECVVASMSRVDAFELHVKVVQAKGTTLEGIGVVADQFRKELEILLEEPKFSDTSL